MKYWRTFCSFILVPILVCVSTLVAAQTAAPGGKPVTIAGAAEYGFTSAINARDYRLFVYLPPDLDPSLTYQVLYVLDGNVYFASGTDMLRRQLNAGIAAPALVVGIGYPGTTIAEWVPRRSYDFTPSLSIDPEETRETGGASLFLRVIEEEIKPFIEARYNVDRARQILYGQSLGGLFVMHTLFSKPEAFSTWISSSPSLWFNEQEVLQGEAAFAERAKAGELHVSLLLTSAGDEQYRGDDPELLEEGNRFRMVENASELAARLGELKGENFRIERVIFDGETHDTVPFVALNRALRFALPAE